jgi:hypothetical protein
MKMTAYEIRGAGLNGPHLHLSDSETPDEGAETTRQRMEAESGKPVACKKISEIEYETQEDLQAWFNTLMDARVVVTETKE